MSLRKPVATRCPPPPVASRLAHVLAVGAKGNTTYKLPLLLPGEEGYWKRLRQEFIKFQENLPDEIEITWTEASSASMGTDMIPTQFIISLGPSHTHYNIIVRFSKRYPFEAPFYYVQLKNGGGLEDLKQHLSKSATSEEDKMHIMNRHTLTIGHSPSNVVWEYVKSILDDEKVMSAFP